MKWRTSSKKFVANITVHQLKGLKSSPQLQDPPRFSVEIKWKGSKGNALTSFRRSVRRNFTKEEIIREKDGVVEWNEEFQSVCDLSIWKDGVFHPWDVSFTVFKGSKHHRASLFATASLNLADFVTTAAKHGSELNVPLAIRGDTVCRITSLSLSIFLQELKNLEETSETTTRSMFSFPRSPCYGEAISQDKEELPDLRTGSKKANTFHGIFAQNGKRTGHEEEVSSDGRSSIRSEEAEFTFSLETESSDDSDERESKDVSFVRKSFSYGTLAYANHTGVSKRTNTSSSEDEDWIYFSHRNSDAGQVYSGDSDASKPDKSPPHGFKNRLLPWRKRKLSFRSPKVKGEPLLKNYNGEEGGDDIDFDRRQLGSSDETTFEKPKTEEDSVADQSSSCVFGDDNFAVGVWEDKEIVSRDGLKKLKTQVFFASIDQRSERAAGESACTALVAVIADWLQSNHEMPIKSQLDSLIREGSLEWRNLCENDTYLERFPDKHFDLETVLEAEVRPLSIVPEKSFVGFFHPDGLEDKRFDFLQGAMSFDNIWDEICICASKNDPSSNDPLVYIISWNDHFFVLKIEHDFCYIIDTLGERLFEGCNQAFILMFDKDTTIYQIEKEARKSVEKSEKDDDTPRNNDDHESLVLCMGKDSCKEYIKSFLAAIPIRELEDDLKKGLVASTSIHHRLQIEFHFTRCWPILKTELPAMLSSAPTESDES